MLCSIDNASIDYLLDENEEGKICSKPYKIAHSLISSQKTCAAKKEIDAILGLQASKNVKI